MTMATTIRFQHVEGQDGLYRINGGTIFSDVTIQANLSSEKVRFGTGCTFVYYDHRGNPDLFVATTTASL